MIPDQHTTTWPTTFDLILDLVPTIWVDDILMIDPAYLEARGLG